MRRRKSLDTGVGPTPMLTRALKRKFKVSEWPVGL